MANLLSSPVQHYVPSHIDKKLHSGSFRQHWILSRMKCSEASHNIWISPTWHNVNWKALLTVPPSPWQAMPGSVIQHTDPVASENLWSSLFHELYLSSSSEAQNDGCVNVIVIGSTRERENGNKHVVICPSLLLWLHFNLGFNPAETFTAIWNGGKIKLPLKHEASQSSLAVSWGVGEISYKWPGWLARERLMVQSELGRTYWKIK